MKSSKKTDQPSRADEVYEVLKQDIAGFKLIPGDRFTENEIGLRLGVSRTPVRQALTRLQQEGYVEVLIRSGWRVLPFNFEQFEQLYDLRMVLEIAAAQRLCGDSVNDPQKLNMGLIDELIKIWHVAPDQRSTDAEYVSRLDESFHSTIIAATGNTEMMRVHRDVTERIRIIRRLDFTKQPRIEATYEEHGEILRAIQKKRGDLASMLLRAHIETSQAEVRKITLHQLYLARQGEAS